MLMVTSRLTVIGYADTPFEEQSGTPIQPWADPSVKAQIHILPEYREGLADVGGFERIWLVSWLHEASGFALRVVPLRDTVKRGLFATRAPHRPNPIGLSLVSVQGVDVKTGIIRVCGIDLLNGTPILDIKPYIAQFESIGDSRSGWFEKGNDTRFADGRFDGRA